MQALTKGDVNDLRENEFEYDDDQMAAVDACLDAERRVVSVTGEAGTGKTTILRDVHRLWQKHGKSVVLCAPTGKAAKRITEATGIEAFTVHRLLEYPMPGEIDETTGQPMVSSDPRRDRRNPIEAEVVLCDEYAMVNTEVHRNLFDALPFGGLIRVFGDANQLQPIESSKRLQARPSPFNQLLAKKDGIWLTSIHRQSEGSNIITNGHRIINGIIPKRSEDFMLKITEEPVETIEGFMMDNLDDGIDYGQIDNQIITATNKGWIGTHSLNGTLQGLLQPADKPYLEVTRHKWYESPYLRLFVGDKVIQTKNMYALDIFNGETGIVEMFDDAGGVVVNFGDKTVAIPMALEMDGRDGPYHIDPQKDLDLAYVITTHKAQGSEYNEICYVMNRSRSYGLNRKNFYTAISRARSKVTVVSDQKSMTLSLAKKGDR
jgi:exodeoxyribonuclease V alpha subunit